MRIFYALIGTKYINDYKYINAKQFNKTTSSSILRNSCQHRFLSGFR